MAQALDPSAWGAVPDAVSDAPPPEGFYDGRMHVTIRPDAAPMAVDPRAWGAVPVEPPSTTADIAKSLGTGLVNGVIGLAGLPGDLRTLVHKGFDKLAGAAERKLGYSEDDIARRSAAMASIEKDMPLSAPPSDAIRGGVEDLIGPLYQPQTRAGNYARSAAEFLPAAMMGPGGALKNALRFGVLPGLASEAAGEVTAGSPIEPYARAATAIGTGVGAGILSRPATAERALAAHIAPDVSVYYIGRATAIMQRAQAKGIALTWPEALSQAMGRPVLTDVQRILESSAQSRPTMERFFADRPRQIENAMRSELDTIAPPNASPSAIGPAVADSAERSLSDVRGAINDFAEPFYSRSATVLLSPQEMARVRALPGYPEAASAVRSDPQLNRYIGSLPENSVGFLNEVKKYLDQQATNTNRPFAPNPNMQRAAGYRTDASAVRSLATNASLDYATALGVESAARERYLEPLMSGPLGKIAQWPDTRGAIAALFPANPLPNSEREISTAVSALSKRTPQAAAGLVRAYAEMTFNDAAKNLQSGANQFGGAKFAAIIAGNPQQRANLRAAIEALPNGSARWAGFEKMLDVLEATGTRQPIGSRTAFNEQELKGMSTGSLVGNAAKLSASPGKWWSVVSEKWSQWQLGRNLEDLARIVTDPGAGADLRRLASIPTGAREAQLLTARIVAQIGAAPPPQINQRGERKQ